MHKNFRVQKESGFIKLRSIVIVILLTVIWVVLVESIEPIFLILGLLSSVVAVYFTKVFLPLKDIEDINFAKLMFYPIFVIGQVILAGLYVTKVVLFGGRVDIVRIQTDIKSKPLKAILEASITITPGSIYVTSEGEEGNQDLIVLWLRAKNEPKPQELPNINEAVKGSLEERLLKAQK